MNDLYEVQWRGSKDEAEQRTQIGNTPTCDECGEQHGESDCTGKPMPWCEHCQGYHHATAECIKKAVETIDITPEGCKTPEGAKRVNDAMNAFQESREEVARLATALFRNKTYVMMRSVLEAQDEQEALDYLDSLSDAVEARLKAEEAFLRAIAGRISTLEKEVAATSTKPKLYDTTLNGKTVQITIPED